MRWLIGMFALCAVGLPPLPAASQQDYGSGNFVLPHCRSAVVSKKTGSTYVEGICIGAIDAVVALGGVHPGPSPRGAICAPDNATREQAVRVVVRYMETNPGQLQMSFVTLAFAALSQAWACK
jgi:hypothetical protein